MVRRRLFPAVAALLLACSARPPAKLPPAPAVSSDYIDLQPSWRLRVITPVLKSGGYRMEFAGQRMTGNSITLAAGDELLGYETSYYKVESRGRGGVRIEFSSAGLTKVVETLPEPLPKLWRLRLPKNARFVRLLYLKRVSQADHNMAVVAAKSRGALDALTKGVQANPEGACRTGSGRFCSWVPAGIAVRPELKRDGDTAGSWGPVR